MKFWDGFMLFLSLSLPSTNREHLYSKGVTAFNHSYNIIDLFFYERFAKKKFEKETRDIMAARADSSFALMAGLR